MALTRRPFQLDTTIFPSNKEIALAFINAQRLTSGDVWYSYVHRVDGEPRTDFAFWLNDHAWRVLCNDTRSVGGDQMQAIINRADLNDEVTQSCVSRLKIDEISTIHLAAAVLAGEIAKLLPKPPAMFHSTDATTPS